jgi:hypothetical protein
MVVTGPQHRPERGAAAVRGGDPDRALYYIDRKPKAARSDGRLLRNASLRKVAARFIRGPWTALLAFQVVHP